jgi:phosphohistidine phosphatase
MKKIILIRHAKSSWKFPELKDVERPLKKRGVKDAALMANVLKETNVTVDLMYSSPAERAMATAKAFAAEMGIEETNIVTEPLLYMESRTKMRKLVSDLDDRYNSVALVSHNPELTDFANQLTGEQIEWIPTSGFVCVEFTQGTWKEAEGKTGKLLFFEFPKKHRKKIEKDESKIL